MKKAFTLAETLITLMIIGVIATLMYRALVDARPDEEALMYRKAFYAVEEVIRTLANDSTKYDDDELLFMQDSKDGSDYNEVFCKYVAGTLNTLGTIDCTSSELGTNANLTESKVNFKLTNGMAFGNFNDEFSDEDSDSLTPDTITVCVDVNGIGNGPDKGCKSSDKNVKKRDQYKIRIQHDGKVMTGEGSDWDIETEILENRRISKKK